MMIFAFFRAGREIDWYQGFRPAFPSSLSNRSKKRVWDDFRIYSTLRRESTYNRIKFDGRLLYVPIGRTKGYGTLHLTNETFDAMRELINARNILVTNRFGDGPVWRMRVIRTACEMLRIDPDFLLRHSFQRNIYAIPLARNFRPFLQGVHTRLNYFDYPMSSLVEFWRERWLSRRKTNLEVIARVAAFRPEQFTID